LPEKWKASIIVPVYKTGDKTDCSNYRGICFLSTTYNILSNFLLSRSIQYEGNYWTSSIRIWTQQVDY